MAKLRYRLEVEGWPEEFVTHPSITHANFAAGRTVLSGLSYSGLKFSERIIPLEAKIQASGMTFRIVPTHQRRLSDFVSTDPVLASLTTVPLAQVRLTASLDEDDTTISVSGGTLPDGVYHIGTEAIAVDTYPNIVRNFWQTLPQTHNVPSDRSIFVYDRPVTMEGRRCLLYVYEDDSDVADDGELIWRGVIGNPPRMDRDGTTWIIQAQPITSLLTQTIGGGYAEAHPAGLYFNWRQAFYCKIYYGTDPEVDYWEITKQTGLFNEATFIAAVNAQLVTALAGVAGGAAAADFDLLRIERDTGGWCLVVNRNTSGPGVFLGAIVGSYATGFASTAAMGKHGGAMWETPTGLVIPGFEMLSAGQYRLRMTTDAGYEYDGDAGAIGPYGNEKQFKASAEVSAPDNRIYIDQDYSGVSSIHLTDIIDPTGAVFAPADNGDAAYTYDVLATGTTTHDGADYHYIEIDVTDIDKFWLNGATKIEVLRNYTREGSVVDFIDSVVEQSIHANDGDTPFITYADFSNALAIAGDALGTDILFRRYAFTKQLALGDILSRELQLCAHFLRIGADGRMEFAPIVVPTIGSHSISIGHSDIITPHETAGSWVTVEPQRDGAVTSVSVQQKYDAFADEWIDKPITITDADAISTHKNRGRGKVEIKTYSRPVLEPDYVFIKSIAERFMGFGSREYMVVTLEVPRSFRDVLCGDIVGLSFHGIPDGNGLKGVTDAAAMVIERHLSLDPAVEEHVKLVVWMTTKQIGGYCPSALVTGQSNTSGDTWEIAADSANPVNMDLSVAPGGDVARSFKALDRVRITQILSETPTTVDGVVDSVAGDVITVTFDGTWTPGSDAWFLSYIDDTDATVSQLRQVFVADSTLSTQAGLRRFL